MRLKQDKVLSDFFASEHYRVGLGLTRATVKLKERVYSQDHFLDSSSKPIKRKTDL